MSSQWITGHIVGLLGLDKETVGTQITPMLEGIKDKVSLKRQLEDLVGFSAEAKSFVTTYVNARFPPPPPPAVKQAPRTIKLGPAGLSLTRNAAPPSGKKGSASAPASGSRAPSGRATPGSGSGRAPPVDPSVVDAFGKHGHVYIKGRLEDESAWAGRSATASAGGSRAGSGRTTPDGVKGSPQPQRYRQAGALVSNLAPNARASAASQSKSSRPSTPPPPPTQQELDAIEAAKSDDVRRLEKLIRELVMLDDAPDEAAERRRKTKLKEPCFCLARLHPLSPYTPSCSSCGFIACYLQLPHVPCPSCGTPLLTPLARQRVVRRIEGELAEQLRREEHERDEVERAKREVALVQSGGEAFPTLGGPKTGAGTSAGAAAMAAQQARKVLTLGAQGGKTKSKASVTTYTKTAAPAPTAKATRQAQPQVTRVPRPSADVLSEQELNTIQERDKLFRAQTRRPFARLPLMRDGMDESNLPEAVYVPVKEAEQDVEKASGKRSKKKGKGVDGAVVPGAG